MTKSKNGAHLENSIYEQIVSCLKKELDLSGLEAPNELKLNTVTQQATKPNLRNPSRKVTTARSQATTAINAINSNSTQTRAKPTKFVVAVTTKTTTVVKQNVTPTTKTPLLVIITTQTTERTDDRELSTHLVRYVAKPITPQKILLRSQCSKQTASFER